MIKEVGQALNKYRYKNRKNGLDIPCIGVASWGYTTGKEQLQRSSSIGSESAATTTSTKRFRLNPGIDAAQLVKNFFYLFRFHFV